MVNEIIKFCNYLIDDGVRFILICFFIYILGLSINLALRGVRGIFFYQKNEYITKNNKKEG